MNSFKKSFGLAMVGLVSFGACMAFASCDEPEKPIEVGTEEEMVAALASEEVDKVIKLTSDLVITDTLRVEKKVTIDMNGKKISNTADIWQDVTEPESWSLVSVDEGGDLVVTGNGSMISKENDCYTIDIVRNGKCTIENGTYVGNVHAIYVNEGELTVHGGTFSVLQKFSNAKPYDYVLNCYDASYKAGTAKITVTGGTYKGFNPGDCYAEGEHTSFLADGYKVNADTSAIVNYTVVANA